MHLLLLFFFKYHAIIHYWVKLLAIFKNLQIYKIFKNAHTYDGYDHCTPCRNFNNFGLKQPYHQFLTEVLTWASMGVFEVCREK